MTPTLVARLLAALLVASANLCASDAEAADFASARPAARVEYWQQRRAAIDARVADAASLRAVKLVFVGDSITVSGCSATTRGFRAGCTRPPRLG